jgi:hypothetical protein
LPRTSKTRANLFPVRRCGAKLHSRLVTIATSGSLQAPASLGSFDCVAFSLTSCSRHSSSPFLCRPIPPPSPLCPLHPLPSPHRLVYSLDLLFLSVSIIPPCDFFSALLFSSLLFSSLLFSSSLPCSSLLFSSLLRFSLLLPSPLAPHALTHEPTASITPCARRVEPSALRLQPLTLNWALNVSRALRAFGALAFVRGFSPFSAEPSTLSHVACACRLLLTPLRSLFPLPTAPLHFIHREPHPAIHLPPSPCSISSHHAHPHSPPPIASPACPTHTDLPSQHNSRPPSIPSPPTYQAHTTRQPYSPSTPFTVLSTSHTHTHPSLPSLFFARKAALLRLEDS